MNTCVKCGSTHGNGSTAVDAYCGHCQVLLGFRSRMFEDMDEERFGGFKDGWRRRQKSEPIPYRLLRVEYWPEVEADAVLSRSPRYDSTVDYFQSVEKQVSNRRRRRLECN